MVGVTPTVPARDGLGGPRAASAGRRSRFLSADHRAVRREHRDLAGLVAEIVTEYTDHLVAERDALAEDLAWDLNAARTTADRGRRWG